MKDTQSLDQLLSQLDSPKKDHRNRRKTSLFIINYYPNYRIDASSKLPVLF